MCNVGIQPWWSHDNDDDDKDDDDDDDDGDADGNDDDDDWPTSHLRAHTFLHSAQICLGFNLKMIEAFPDGPSNSKYNSQRTAGAGRAGERNMKYLLGRKIGLSVHHPRVDWGPYLSHLARADIRWAAFARVDIT